MSLSSIAGQAIAHTPAWVWGLLILITVLGLRQARDHVLSSGRVIGVSIGWTVFSLVSAATSFGAGAGVLLAWLGGLVLSVAVQQGLVEPHGVKALGDGRFAIRGSLWPLATFWLVFAVRYVSSVMLVLDPTLKQHAVFALAVPAVYGLLSGLFVGRAMRVLGQPGHTLAAA